MTAVPLEAAEEESDYGGKASALARARRAALPVPPGWALSWDLVAAMAAGDAEATTAAVAAFERCERPVSVRSSAIGEDSAGASFAGQHATLLNVTSVEQFLDAVAAVHLSARSEAALAYRARLGVAGEPRIAVVVQKMVAPDCAGVLFTRNPHSGADERLVESAWGLGEAVVAGLVVPDRFRVARGGAVLERYAGLKDVAIVASAAGRTEEVPVDAARARALTLDDAQLGRLDELATRCENAFGGAQDIEWAFAGRELYLLQSRPITASAAFAAAAAPPSELVSGAPGAGAEPPPPLPTRRFVGLALAALLSPLNSTIIAVALPDIGTTFAADAAALTRWLVTSYLIVSIVAQSPGGKLADLFGSSRVLTIGRGLFALGAAIAAFAPTLHVLALGRIAMAAGGALTIPTVMAELRNATPVASRGRLFGLFGAIMGTAAGIGPLLGGVLTARFGWHSIFVVNLPVVALSFLLERPHRQPRRQTRAAFDMAGGLLFAAAILLLVFALQRRDALALAMVAAGVVLGVLFVRRERAAAEPMLDVGLFASRPFSAGCSIVALQNLAMYATLFLLPFLLAHSARAASAGLAMGAMTAAMVIASPLGGRLTDRFGPRAIAFAGSVVAGAGAVLLYSSGVSLDVGTIAALALMGTGLGLSTSPSQAAALTSVSREKAGMASGALSTMRYIGGVAGSALVGVVVALPASPLPLVVFPAVLAGSAGVALLLPRRLGEAR